MKNHYCIKGLLLTVFLLLTVCILKGQQPSQGHKELPEQYWTDIVTEQPAGYVVDANGNVHIYSAEGLAWLSVLSNGLHGQEADNFDGKTIFLEEDIDLAGFLWHPIATTIWDGSQNNSFYFEGVFYGKGHVIDNMVLVNATDILHFGLFGNIVHGEIRYLVLKNSRVDLGSDLCGGVLAYSIEDNSFISSCIVHCLHFRACSGGMFQDIDPGSFVVNSMIHYNYKYETTGGCGISYENKGNIINCASIIDTLRWSMNGECSGLVAFNDGMIKNSYSYWGELLDYPGYSDYTPRNGVTRNNDGGVVKNCYYNRMPEEYLFDDEPGYGGVFQDVSSFDMYLASWWLTNPVHVGTNVAWSYELVDALNYWIDHQSNSDDYRKWVVEHNGYNHGLPYFRRLIPEQYWTDIVTEQPEGYVVDANGDVHIYSAQGLVWLCVLSNGLHGQEADNFDGKTIFLEEDIDLAGFLWHPIAITIWDGSQNNSFYFKGVFNGKGHVIDNMVLVKDFYISHFGLFGNVVHGEIRNLVLKNSWVEIGDNFYGGVLAYSIEDNSFVDNCIVHCLYFRSQYGGLFTFILSGSSVVNCMIHYDYCKEGGSIAEGNWGTILNCASITDTLCWNPHGCPGVLFVNGGLVKNCYSYLGALWDFPGYSGYAPRKGIAADNDGGVVENCYYNRMPEEYLFDDEPGDAGLDGVFQDVSSFDRDGASWWLTNPVHIGTNPAVAYELVDALNYWVDNQFDSYNYLRWGIDNTGVNYGLPVFSDFGFMETLEQENNDEVLFYPNPVNSVVYVKSKDILCVNLFNTDGRRINSLGTVENSETVPLDLVGLKPGLYFLETINNEGYRIIKKVVKQ